MNKLLTSAAILGALAVSTSVSAQDHAAPAGKVKCFGVAEAGKNDCKSADGVNSCAGSSTRDKNANDWKSLTAEECKAAGGSETAPVAAPAAEAAPAATAPATTAPAETPAAPAAAPAAPAATN